MRFVPRCLVRYPRYPPVRGDEVEIIAANIISRPESSKLRLHSHRKELWDQSLYLEARICGRNFAERVVFSATVGVAARAERVYRVTGRVGIASRCQRRAGPDVVLRAVLVRFPGYGELRCAVDGEVY